MGINKDEWIVMDDDDHIYCVECGKRMRLVTKPLKYTPAICKNCALNMGIEYAVGYLDYNVVYENLQKAWGGGEDHGHPKQPVQEDRQK